MRRTIVALLIGCAILGGAAGGEQVGSAAQGATPAATPAACPATTEAENAAIARRWHEEVVSGHDLAILDEILAPAAPHDSGTFADNPGTRVVLAALLKGFPDVTHTVDLVVAQDDLVVVRYTATGTHLGEFQGYAPTGKQVTWTGINIYRISCGRIAQVWTEVDGLGRAEQIGRGMDAPAGTPAP